MKKSTKNNESKNFKLKIDHKIIITVKSKKTLKIWLEKYPNAKTIS